MIILQRLIIFCETIIYPQKKYYIQESLDELIFDTSGA